MGMYIREGLEDAHGYETDKKADVTTGSKEAVHEALDAKFKNIRPPPVTQKPIVAPASPETPTDTDIESDAVAQALAEVKEKQEAEKRSEAGEERG